MKKHLMFVLFFLSGGYAALCQTKTPPPDTPYISNSTFPPQNANFNITGIGVIGGQNDLLPPLTVMSTNSRRTSILMTNTNTSLANWSLDVNNLSATGTGSFRLVNLSTNKAAIGVSPYGWVAINTAAAPNSALDVDGDISATGTFQMGMKYITYTGSVDAHSKGIFLATCPAGYRVVSGGGGHRDYNNALKDIQIGFSGPDEDSPNTTWRIMLYNNGGSSRAIRVSCTCARIN